MKDCNSRSISRLGKDDEYKYESSLDGMPSADTQKTIHLNSSTVHRHQSKIKIKKKQWNLRYENSKGDSKKEQDGKEISDKDIDSYKLLKQENCISNFEENNYNIKLIHTDNCSYFLNQKKI